MKKGMYVALCVLVTVVLIFGACNKGTATSGGLKQSSDNTDLIGAGKGRDYGRGAVGYDLDALVDRLGRDAVKNLKIGVSLDSLKTQWMALYAEEITKLSKEYGFTVVIMSAEGEVTKAEADLKSLQAQQVDGILVFPSNSEALSSTMGEIMRQGIPVIALCAVPDGVEVTASITANELTRGAMVARNIAEDAGGAPRNIMVNCVDVDFPLLNNRRIGFEEEVKKHPNLMIVETRNTRGDAQDYLNAAVEGLLANDTVDTTYGTFSLPVLAAYNAAKQLGRQVDVYGIDVDEVMLQLMMDGDMVKGLMAHVPFSNCYVSLFQLLRVLAGENIPFDTPEADNYAYFFVRQKDAADMYQLMYGK